MNVDSTTTRHQGQYTGTGAAFGAGIGIVVALFGGWTLPIGIAVGAGAGVAIGAALDARRD